MNKITPFLWFNETAEDAANFYLASFPNSRKLNETRLQAQGPVSVIDIEIEGQQITFMNAKGAPDLNEAFSLTLRCETQEEIDVNWEKLKADGGAEIACGWLKDKFGVRWQVVPTRMAELLKKPGAMQAMMAMKKLSIAGLENAGAS
jgi:predicted 3-demethylubiquinone-9 3-methyltransferase (glyoxalase superfamily)